MARGLTGGLLAGLLLVAGCGAQQQSTGGSAAPHRAASGSPSAGPPSSPTTSSHRATSASTTTGSSPSASAAAGAAGAASTSGSASASGSTGSSAAVTSSVPSGFQPYSVTYVSSTTGYVLGASSCTTKPCTAVVRTTDGGASWHSVPGPHVPSTGGQGGPYVARPGAVRDIRFASPTNGWAFGGALYATHDAAAHWHHVTMPGQVLDVETGGTTAYAVVASCNSTGASCQNERLYASPVGSDAWKQVTGVTGSGPVTGAGGELSIAGGHAVAVLGTRLYVRTSSGWKLVANPCPRPAQGVDMASASATGSALFALCNTGAAAGSVYFAAYRSTDGGQHWTRRTGTRSLRTSDGSQSLAAASASTVALATSSVDLRGGVTVSWDGGATWHVAAVPNLSQGWRYVGARGGASFVALPGKPTGSIYLSTDGGHSWHAQRVG